MRHAVPIALAALLAACQPNNEIAELRAEIAQQRQDIDRLSVYVDAQAHALRLCFVVMNDLVDLPDKSIIGTMRGAKEQWTNATACKEAAEQFITLTSSSR